MVKPRTLSMERLCSGKIPEGKGKVTVGSHLMVPKPSQCRNFSANTHCKVNSALLPHPVNKSQLLCSWFEPLFLSCSTCRNSLPTAPAPNLASAAKSFSQFSHSPAQSLLPLLRYPFQNPLRSVGKYNGSLLPSCQTPLQGFLFPLPSLTRNALSKTFSVPLCQCNLVTNTFTLSPWTSAPAHNFGLK